MGQTIPAPPLVFEPTFHEDQGVTGLDRDRIPRIGLRSGFAFDVPVVREGTLHVRCRMPGCTSEYVSNEKSSSKGVRYVCSKHTDAQLRRAGILKTDRTDQDAHFDEPEYLLSRKTPASSPEWSRAFTRFQNQQSDAQYAADSNGRNDSDRGHAPTSGVHRPNKAAPGRPAYKPVDPAKLFSFRRSVWNEPVFKVAHHPCNTELVGDALVSDVDPLTLLLSRSASSFYGEDYPQTLVKCGNCGLEVMRVAPTVGALPWLCPDCDTNQSEDDISHRHSPFFSARRGDTGEEIEAIPADTLAQEKRLDEIITRWKDHIEFARKHNLIDDEAPRKQIVEFLRSDQKFRSDVLDFQAIDEGKKLEDKMATKRRRDLMNRIVNSSVLDPLRPDLDWAQFLKPGSKELQLFRAGGTFLVVKQDRYRLYRLDDFDMRISSNGLSFLGLTEPFQKRLNTAIQNARKAARKRHLSEDEAAQRTFAQFMKADVIQVRPPKKSSRDPLVTVQHSV